MRRSTDRASGLVIGEILLDKYVQGEAQRISPEAPEASCASHTRTMATAITLPRGNLLADTALGINSASVAAALKVGTTTMTRAESRGTLHR